MIVPGVEIQLSQSDALAAARLHHLAYMCGRFCAVVVATLTVVYAALMLFLLGSTRDGLTMAGVGVLIIPAMLYGMLLVRHAILPRLAVRRQFRQFKAASQPYQIAWSQRSYSARGPSLQSDIPWDDYWRWREDGRVLLLYPSSLQYQVVPKRLLPPGAVEQIRGYLTDAGIKRAPILLS